MSTEVIVCAATKFYLGNDRYVVVPSVRHYDSLCHGLLDHLPHIAGLPSVQGFVTNRQRFVDREQAYSIAYLADQIKEKSGNPTSRTLFSEDIY